jgi:hypothetical protein
MKRLAFLAAVACLCSCALPGSGTARADFITNGAGSRQETSLVGLSRTLTRPLPA